LACNGGDNRCVVPSTVEPFACDPGTEREPDNDISHAFAVAALGCVSRADIIDGCLAAHDDADWFSFDAPSSCTAVEVQLRLTFPVAWEPLVTSLASQDGTIVAGDDVCPDVPASDTSGDAVRCLKLTLTPGSHYGASITPAGGGDCSGDCAFNRY